MSYHYGQTSRGKLATCHKDLQKIMNIAIQQMDISILQGYRDEETQNIAYARGQSKLKYPDSKHNKVPSMAVDAAPYPIDWDDTERFAHMVGIVQGVARVLYNNGEIEHLVRSGADWDNDNDFTDHSLLDWPHLELYKPNA